MKFGRPLVGTINRIGDYGNIFLFLLKFLSFWLS